MAYIAIILSLINIFLLVFILVKFKKLFSTDSIIENTRFKMDRMIADINNNTQRDLDLLKETSNNIKGFIKEADQKMVLFQEATQRLRDMIAIADQINKYSNKQNSLYQDFNKISQMKPNVRKNMQAYQANQSNQPYVDPEARFQANTNGQQELFSQQESGIIKDETNFTQDGAAYREVPLIITKVYDEKPVNKDSFREKTLKEKVEDLYNQGMSVENIASELSCSMTEVQLIIDMT